MLLKRDILFLLCDCVLCPPNRAFWPLTEVLVVVSCGVLTMIRAVACSVLSVCTVKVWTNLTISLPFTFCLHWHSACTALLSPSVCVSASALSVLWIHSCAHFAPSWETEEAWPPLSAPSSQNLISLHRVSPPVPHQTGDMWRDRVTNERSAWWETSVTASSTESGWWRPVRW